MKIDHALFSHLKGLIDAAPSCGELTRLKEALDVAIPKPDEPCGCLLPGEGLCQTHLAEIRNLGASLLFALVELLNTCIALQRFGADAVTSVRAMGQTAVAEALEERLNALVANQDVN